MDPSDETSPDDDAPVEPEPGRRARRRSAMGGVGEVVGNAIVGFDYLVFRATKPPAILVESAKPVRGLSGEGGTMLSIEFPEESVESTSADDPDAGPA